MSKHLVDLDEQALAQARVRLGTATIRDTVNQALRRAAAGHEGRARKAIEALASVPLADRAEAWR